MERHNQLAVFGGLSVVFSGLIGALGHFLGTKFEFFQASRHPGQEALAYSRAGGYAAPIPWVGHRRVTGRSRVGQELIR